jgi:hypothetical protein
VREFAAEYHREPNRLNAARERAQIAQRDELATVERKLRKIADGVPARTPKDELLALEARKDGLAAVLKRQAPEPAPRRHPKLADLYHEKVAHLVEEMNRPELRGEASEICAALWTRSASSLRTGDSRSRSPAIWPRFWRWRTAVVNGNGPSLGETGRRQRWLRRRI